MIVNDPELSKLDISIGLHACIDCDRRYICATCAEISAYLKDNKSNDIMSTYHEGVKATPLSILGSE